MQRAPPDTTPPLSISGSSDAGSSSAPSSLQSPLSATGSRAGGGAARAVSPPQTLHKRPPPAPPTLQATASATASNLSPTTTTTTTKLVKRDADRVGQQQHPATTAPTANKLRKPTPTAGALCFDDPNEVVMFTDESSDETPRLGPGSSVPNQYQQHPTRRPEPVRQQSYSKRHASFDTPREVPLPFPPQHLPALSLINSKPASTCGTSASLSIEETTSRTAHHQADSQFAATNPAPHPPFQPPLQRGNSAPSPPAGDPSVAKDYFEVPSPHDQQARNDGIAAWRRDADAGQVQASSSSEGKPGPPLPPPMESRDSNDSTPPASSESGLDDARHSSVSLPLPGSHVGDSVTQLPSNYPHNAPPLRPLVTSPLSRQPQPPQPSSPTIATTKKATTPSFHSKISALITQAPTLSQDLSGMAIGVRSSFPVAGPSVGRHPGSPGFTSSMYSSYSQPPYACLPEDEEPVTASTIRSTSLVGSTSTVKQTPLAPPTPSDPQIFTPPPIHPLLSTATPPRAAPSSASSSAPISPVNSAPGTGPIMTVMTNPAAYILETDLVGFQRDEITISTRKKRILHVVADGFVSGKGGHYERRISFGYDADMAKIRAEFNGSKLKITVPRRPIFNGGSSAPWTGNGSFTRTTFAS